MSEHNPTLFAATLLQAQVPAVWGSFFIVRALTKTQNQPKQPNVTDITRSLRQSNDLD